MPEEIGKDMNKLKSGIITFVFGLIFWLCLNGWTDPAALPVGVFVSLVVTLFLTKKELFADVHFSPKAFVAFFTWLAVFTVELVKSNIDVMRRVLAPKVRINPAIVAVKTTLKSKLGRLALANSITLTPGTLTVDIQEDKLYIHWIDATSTDIEGATRKIVSKFEKYLEVIFG